MEYKISEVVSFSEQTYGKFGNHRAVVKLEGVEKQRSAFLKLQPKAGDVWSGELTETNKDGRTFYNFEFAKKADSGGGDKFGTSAAEIKNMIDLRVIPLIEQNAAAIAKAIFLIQALGDRLEKVLAMGGEDEPNEDTPF